jgi:ADP-ribose pyrophosphatase YjhB (NUDIX family)
MEDFLKGVYANLLNEQINLSAHYGKAVTFPYLFQNSSQAPASYKISVLHVAQEAGEEELTVVKNYKEWRFFVAEQYPSLDPATTASPSATT